LTKKPNKDSMIEQRILEIVAKENPESVEQLVKLVKERLLLKDEALKHVLHLVNQGKIKLKEPLKPIPKSLITYMLSSEAYWFWTTIILVIATTIVVFTVPEDAYPIVYLRYVLGLIFILWLPGYTFIKALFPTKVPIPTSSTELDNIERIALSVGMSLAIVPMIGLLLYYTPFGIGLAPITLSLLALTIALATVAIIREHRNKMKAEKSLSVRLQVSKMV